MEGLGRAFQADWHFENEQPDFNEQNAPLEVIQRGVELYARCWTRWVLILTSLHPPRQSDDIQSEGELSNTGIPQLPPPGGGARRDAQLRHHARHVNVMRRPCDRAAVGFNDQDGANGYGFARRRLSHQ